MLLLSMEARPPPPFGLLPLRWSTEQPPKLAKTGFKFSTAVSPRAESRRGGLAYRAMSSEVLLPVPCGIVEYPVIARRGQTSHSGTAAQASWWSKDTYASELVEGGRLMV